MSGFECDSVCTESQATLNVWHHRKKFRGGSNLTRVEVTAISSAKASVTMSLTVGIRVFTCVCLHICVFVFPLRAISEGQIVSNFSSQIWASEFDTKCALFFCFCKEKEKKNQVLLQNAHAKILHWSDYPAVVELWKSGVEKEDLKFVEIFWGFYNKMFV